MNRYWKLVWAALAVQCILPAAGAQQSAFSPESPAGWSVVFGRPEFQNASRMALDPLNKESEAIEKERESVIGNLRSRAELDQYRATVRARLREAIGNLPERTPLHAKRTGILERGNYAVEKILFESRPHYYVTANVYVPRGISGPFPAVLCPVGHWGTGKSFEDYQRLGIYLARRGFVVLVYDLPGQGERLIYYDSVMGRSAVDPATSEYYVTIEHGMAVGPTTLVSGNLAPYMVWDGMRALDYLCERKDVDRERIACTGTSGGGVQTELLSALDERIKVSIPVSYGGCAADMPDRPGLTMTDVDALIAPRPLLMMNTTGDSDASVIGKRRRHAAVANIYKLLGASDRTGFLIGEGRHGYLQGLREAAYEWLSQWFNSSAPPPERLPEPPTEIESQAALDATTTGQVKTALGGETILSLDRAAARKAGARTPPPARREDIGSWREKLRQQVTARLRLTRQESSLRPQVIARLDKGDYTLEKIVYYSEPEIYIPSLLFLPKTKSPAPAVLFVNENGKSADSIPENYLAPLAKAGYAVLAIDARGWGETTAPTEAPYNQRNYRGFTQDSEADLFYAALRSGKTILGLRVLDVLRGVDFLESRPEVDQAKIAAIGRGAGGLLVLYAAALDERIRTIACTRTLTAYSAILNSELYAHRFSGFVPGVLQSFDLPDLAAMAAPRPLLLLNSVDQRDRRADSKRVAKLYEAAQGVYNSMGAGEKLRIEQADSAGETLDIFEQNLGK